MHCSLIIILCTFISFITAYKPVILLHGILTGWETMEVIKSRIQEVTFHLMIIILFKTKPFLETSWYNSLQY